MGSQVSVSFRVHFLCTSYLPAAVLGAGERGEQDMTLGGSRENQEVECGWDGGNLNVVQMGQKRGPWDSVRNHSHPSKLSMGSFV